MAIESKKTEELTKDEEKAISESAKRKAIEALKQKVVIIDASHLAEMEARDAGDAHMTESKGKAGFWKKLWEHTFFDEYYRQKEINKVRNEIVESGNIYTATEKDKKGHDGAMNAIVDRFSSEYEETINKNAGENKETLEENNPETLKIKTEIKNLISDYAKGPMTEEIFKSEKSRIFNSINNDSVKGATTYADNLFEMAKNAKLAIEHGAKLEELDFDFDIIVGKAKSSIKTEAKHNMVDKAVDWTKKSAIGRFVNPATLSVALGLAYSVSAFAGKRFLNSKLSHISTFGLTAVASGAFAAMNESQRLAEERRQHGREMAKGGKTEDGSPRREEMEKYSYKTESASDLIKNLRYSLSEIKDNKNISESELATIISNINNIEARNNLGDRKKIDLISYSSPENVEKERTEMTILLAKSKVELRKQFGDKFDTTLQQQNKTIEESLLGGESGITSKDKSFSNLKLKKSAGKFFKTLLVGVTIGAVVQEGVSLIDGAWGGQREGIFEGAYYQFKGEGTPNNIQTPLEHVRGLIDGNPSHLSMTNAHEQIIGNSHFNLPETTNIITNPDGTYNIVNGDHIVADHINITTDANGALDQESIDRLGESGIIATTENIIIENGSTEPISADEYVKEHLENTKHIKRDLWYDNDTPKPIFDKNELKLHWGGENGTGINADGKYVFNTSHMTSGGSFHDNLSVDAQEKIKAGGLKMLLSLSRDTQNQVFEVDIDANGNAIIDPNSEVGKIFFKIDAQGHAVFQGKFAEVAETFEEKDGAEHVKVLATYVGKGVDEIKVPGPLEIPINNLQIPLDEEPPYFIPLVPRTPLEPIAYKKDKYPETEPITPFLPYYGNTQTSKEELDFYEGKKSKTLKENPKAKLDHYREIGAYFDKMDKKYLERIEKFALSLGNMEKECKVSVCIPVAGHQEGKQIYESLKNYSFQTAKNKNYEISLFVNHPKTDKEGNILNAEETLSEIERFKQENPNIKIKVMYEVLPDEDVNIGKIRKMLSDAILLRQHARGVKASDLIMISNNADNKGIDPRYIESFINQFEKNPEVDAMLGQLDWDPESYQRYPSIHMGTRLFQYLSTLGRRNGGGIASSGANTAYRSSIYAAIGGYMDNVSGGEDVAIGRAIVNARGGDKKRLTFAGVTTRLFTSSRRSIDAMKSGLSPVEQWDKGFSAFDDEVRNMIIEEGQEVDYDNEEIKEKLKKSLEYVFNRTLDVWGKGEELGKNSHFYKKALLLLGVKYKLDKEKNIVITDMDSLVKGLKTYQTEGKLIRDARSGKKEAQKALKDLREKKLVSLKKENPEVKGKKVKPKITKTEEVETKKTPEKINYTEESKRFIDRLEKDSDLMKLFRKQYDLYSGLKNYKKLKKGDPRKDNVDEIYNDYSNKLGDAKVSKEDYLTSITELIEDNFSKELRAREAKEAKEKETLDKESLENEIKISFSKVLETIREKQPEILNLKLTFDQGKGFIVDSEIKIGNTGRASKPNLNAHLSLPFEIKNGNLELGESYSIESGLATRTATEQFKPIIDLLAKGIKNTLEEKFNKKINFLEIGEEKLSIVFKD